MRGVRDASFCRWSLIIWHPEVHCSLARPSISIPVIQVLPAVSTWTENCPIAHTVLLHIEVELYKLWLTYCSELNMLQCRVYTRQQCIAECNKCMIFKKFICNSQKGSLSTHKCPRCWCGGNKYCNISSYKFQLLSAQHLHIVGSMRNGIAKASLFFTMHCPYVMASRKTACSSLIGSPLLW